MTEPAGQRAAAGGTVLAGIPASPGSAVGHVQVVRAGTVDSAFQDGAVLVSRTTDPTLVGFMLRASAIVTEIGSRLCHTAIVALELGIPCVVAVPCLLDTLSDGMLVCVDGSSGTVAVLDDHRG